MNWSRYFVAVAAATVAAVVWDILINAVIMRETFEAHAHLWRPAAELNRLAPLAWIALAIAFALEGLLFVRFGGRGLAQGLEFGALLGLAGGVTALAMATLVTWPMRLIGSIALQQLGNHLFLGLIFGWLYRDPGGQ